MGHSKEFYFSLQEELKDQIKIELLDYPETLTYKSHNEILENFAHYFADEIKSKTDKKIHLGGLSLGATLSLRIKDLLDNQVNHLYLMASGGLKVARARREMILFMIEHLGYDEFIKKALNLNDYPSFVTHFSVNTQIMKSYYQSFNQEFWSRDNFKKRKLFFIDQTKAALHVDYEKQLAKYHKDIVFIWAEADKIFSRRHYKKFQNIMPNATYHLLPKLGHYLPLESPKEIAKIILSHGKI